MKLLGNVGLAFGVAAVIASGLVAGLGRAGRPQPPMQLAEFHRYPGDEEEYRRCLEYDAYRPVVMHRLEVKVATAHALLRGEITLTEAARQFREVTEGDPLAMAGLRAAKPATPDDHLHLFNVLGFVDGELWESPDRELRLAPLRAELACLLSSQSPTPID
jgi:hypothetical protein